MATVADLTDKLIEDITASYEQIDTMGGTIPDDKNTENLTLAIRSIPMGGKVSKPMEVKVKMTTGGTLTLRTGGNEPDYSPYIIDWGDGSTPLSGVATTPSHSYPAGEYTILVSRADGNPIQLIPEAMFCMSPYIAGVKFPKSVDFVETNAFNVNSGVYAIADTYDTGDGLYSGGLHMFAAGSTGGTATYKIGKNFRGPITTRTFYSFGGMNVYFNAEHPVNTWGYVGSTFFLNQQSTTSKTSKLVVGKDCKTLPSRFMGNVTASEYCYKLSNITFEEGSTLKSINNRAFCGYENSNSADPLMALTQLTVTLPESLKYIGELSMRGMWKSNKMNTTLNIGNGVEIIANNAFFDNYISHIIIGKSVKNIGALAFRYSRNLTKVTFNAKNCSDLPTVGAFGTSMGESNGGLNIKVIIGADVERIPAHFMHGTGSAAMRCQTVDFSRATKLKYIGDHAFNHHYNAYSNYSGNETWSLPDTVEFIGYFSLLGMFTNASWSLPKQCKFVGRSGLYGLGVSGLSACTAIASGVRNLTLDPDVECTLSENACRYFHHSTATSGEIYVGKNIKRIGPDAFASNEATTSLYWNADCYNDWHSADTSCLPLTNFMTSVEGKTTIGPDVKYIGAYWLCNNSTSRKIMNLDLTQAENLERIGRFGMFSTGSLFMFRTGSADITLPKLKQVLYHGLCDIFTHYTGTLKLPAIETLEYRSMYGFGASSATKPGIYIGPNLKWMHIDAFNQAKIGTLYWDAEYCCDWSASHGNANSPFSTLTGDGINQRTAANPQTVIIGPNVKRIPCNFINNCGVWGSATCLDLTLTEKLEEIGAYALHSVKYTLYKLKFPVTLKVLEDSCLYFNADVTIQYEGTLAQWGKVLKHNKWFPTNTATIVCTDGTTTFKV